MNVFWNGFDSEQGTVVGCREQDDETSVLIISDWFIFASYFLIYNYVHGITVIFNIVF